MAAKKLVILAAVNGGAQQDRDGAKVPITPTEIAEAAHECYKSGASVVHIHARAFEPGDQRDGAWSREQLERMNAQFVARVERAFLESRLNHAAATRTR